MQWQDHPPAEASWVAMQWRDHLPAEASWVAMQEFRRATLRSGSRTSCFSRTAEMLWTPFEVAHTSDAAQLGPAAAVAHRLWSDAHIGKAIRIVVRGYISCQVSLMDTFG